MHREGREIVMIGHAGHPEVEGTMGQCEGNVHLVESVEDVARLDARDASRLAYVTQTTLSIDDAAAIVGALRARFPAIAGPRKGDVCYATQNRQDAVKTLAKHTEVVLVVGSRNSPNSNRLREVAVQHGVPAHLVDGVADIDDAWLDGKRRVGVTAGASAPEVLVRRVVAHLRRLGATCVEDPEGATERVMFALPKDLPIVEGARTTAQPRE